jgi:hypothetical protein
VRPDGLVRSLGLSTRRPAELSLKPPARGEIDLASREIVDGIMSDHTPATITLRQAQGRKAIIARRDIEIMHVRKVTMVPEGLEKHIRFGRPQTRSVCKSRPLMLLSNVSAVRHSFRRTEFFPEAWKSAPVFFEIEGEKHPWNSRDETFSVHAPPWRAPYL